MKTCTRCGTEKPRDQFPPVRRGEPKLQTWCRACFAEANAANYRKHHEREKGRRVARVTVRRSENRQGIIDYLRSHPCVDCGETDIVVLEFDHIGEKIGDVSTLANSGRTWQRISAEIAKCEVRCANCHRKKTAVRRATVTAPSVASAEPRRTETAPLQLMIDKLFDVGVCRVCGLTKPLSEFPFRSIQRQTRRRICRVCQRVYSRNWYERNRSRHIASGRRNKSRARRTIRTQVQAYLASHPCLDCGETDTRVLEFDHVRDKTAEISSLIALGLGWPRIAEEIAKCEVRCANCHRRRSVRQSGGYRLSA